MEKHEKYNDTVTKKRRNWLIFAIALLCFFVAGVQYGVHLASNPVLSKRELQKLAKLKQMEEWKKEVAKQKADPIMPLKPDIVQRPQLRGMAFSGSVVGKQLGEPMERTPVEMCGTVLLSDTKHAQCETVHGKCCCVVTKNDSNEVRCVPSFFIIGAQKSGTTAAVGYLLLHQDYLHTRAKEVHFFDRKKEYNSPEKVQHYMGRMPVLNADDIRHKVLGSATPSYILGVNTPGVIKKWQPGNRFVLFLRNPVDRAVSEYNMEMRRVNMQNEYVERLLKIWPPIQDCFERTLKSGDLIHQRDQEHALADRRGQSEFIDRKPMWCYRRDDKIYEKFFKEPNFFAWLMKNMVNGNRLRDVLQCFREKVHMDRDLSFGSDDYWAATKCFNKANIFIERLLPLDKQFDREMKHIETCLDGDGHVKTGSRPCYMRGASSSLMEGNFLFRSLYATQLRNWFRVLPRDKHPMLIVSNEELRANPNKVMGKVFDFVGLPRADLTSYSADDIQAVINEYFPSFEETSGWRLNSKHHEPSSELRKKLADFFKPFVKDLEDLIQDRSVTSLWKDWS